LIIFRHERVLSKTAVGGGFEVEITEEVTEIKGMEEEIPINRSNEPKNKESKKIIFQPPAIKFE